MTAKHAIVTALEWLCGRLDSMPWVMRASESWSSVRLVRHSCIGCYPLRLAALSDWLDQRWGTGVWGSSESDND